MTHSEAGRIGGRATVERYGHDHMSRIGRRGFSALVKRFGYQRRLALHWLNGRGSVAARYVVPPRNIEAETTVYHALAAELGLDDDPPF